MDDGPTPATPPRAVPPRTAFAAWLGACALLCLAILVAGIAGFALPSLGGRIALPILPSGIAVAALVRVGRGLWPAVFVAEVGIDLWHGASSGTALVVATGLPAGAWLAAWLLERAGFDSRFRRPRDVTLFLATSLLGMAVPATVGTLGFDAYPGVDGPLGAVDWVRWWSNCVAGVLIVAPPLIAGGKESLQRLREVPLASAAYAALVALVAASIVLLPPSGVSSALARPPLYVVALLVLVIGAMRFGLVIATTSAFAMTVAAGLSFDFNLGAFRDVPEIVGLVDLWAFVGSACGVSLIVTALLGERDGAAAARLAAEHRYAEIFEGSPQPLWVLDLASQRFLLVNAATERQYGWSRADLLDRPVDTVAAPGELPTPPDPDATHDDSFPFETRHRTRDGRIIDVETWARPIDFGGRPALLVFAVDVSERRALERALIEAIADEQRRIGQEMHDGLGQELTGLSLTVRALATQAERQRLPLAADLAHLASMIGSSIQSARDIVRGLSPLAGANGNLVAALAALADSSARSGRAVRFQPRIDIPLTLPADAQSHLFRIAQEAVQNALKHADAARIDVELDSLPGLARLTVRDDGRGFDPDAPAERGLGLRTMRYRAKSIGGRFTFRSTPASGTTVTCDCPQPVRAPAARQA